MSSSLDSELLSIDFAILRKNGCPGEKSIPYNLDEPYGTLKKTKADHHILPIERTQYR